MSKPSPAKLTFAFSTTYFRGGGEYDIEGHYTVVKGDEHGTVSLADYRSDHELSHGEECQIEDEILDRYLDDDLAEYEADRGDYLYEQARDREMERLS